MKTEIWLDLAVCLATLPFLHPNPLKLMYACLFSFRRFVICINLSNGMKTCRCVLEALSRASGISVQNLRHIVLIGQAMWCSRQLAERIALFNLGWQVTGVFLKERDGEFRRQCQSDGMLSLFVFSAICVPYPEFT